MANHKFRRSKRYRGHCHLCKFYKDIGNSKKAFTKSRLSQHNSIRDQLKQL